MILSLLALLALLAMFISIASGLGKAQYRRALTRLEVSQMNNYRSHSTQVRIVNAVLLVVVMLMAGCAHPPPNLSPQAKNAWEQTRVLRSLDLIRDTAVDAESKGVMKVEVVRKIVIWHKSAIQVMRASDSGWKTAILTSIDEVQKDLPPPEVDRLKIYFTLAKTVLQEVL